MENIIITILLIFTSFITSYVISVYYKLAKRKECYMESFLDLKSKLCLRYNLITKLINIVKAYMVLDNQFTQQVVQAVKLAENMLEDAAEDPNIATIDQLAAAEVILIRSLKELYNKIDKSQELKTNLNVQRLLDGIELTEKDILGNRRAFNSNVVEYNDYRQSFPVSLVAPNIGHTLNGGLFNFEHYLNPIEQHIVGSTAYSYP